MKTIDILYFDACPGWRGAVERVRQVVSEGGLGAQVEVRAIPIETEEDARTHRFVGSPTVRIDGRDLEPAAEGRTSFGLQCRVYDVDGRLEGLPPTGWIRKALGVPGGASAPSPAAAPCCGGATPRE
jgi:hypothetical protein